MPDRDLRKEGWLEHERHTLLGKCPLLGRKILIAQGLKAPFFPKTDEKGVDLPFQFFISFPKANGPMLFLDGLKQSPDGGEILLPVLPDAHLVIDEGIGPALGDLKHGGVLLVHSEDLRLLQVLPRP